MGDKHRIQLIQLVAADSADSAAREVFSSHKRRLEESGTPLPLPEADSLFDGEFAKRQRLNTFENIGDVGGDISDIGA